MVNSHLSDAYDGTPAIVFGSSGFIGRWVARALRKRGAKVYLVVRHAKLAESIFAAYGIDGDVCELNLESLEQVTKLLQKVRPWIVFNLAGYGMDRSERDSSIAYRINAQLVEVIAATMAQERNPRWQGRDIVHVGTPLEYGTIGGNLSEDSIPNPTTLYGKSKLAGTKLLASSCKAHGIKGLTARPFTVYGPGESPGRLLPSLLEIAKTQKPLQLTSGEQKRDFVYVENVSEGLLRLGLAPAAPGEIVNLATGRLTSVRTFVETAARMLNIPEDRLRFGEIPLLDEEMHHSEVATERLRELTAWMPSTGVADGIQKTIDSISLLSRATDSSYPTAGRFCDEGTKL
jgi:nucleoside-diphosphate-sugar epimerase